MSVVVVFGGGRPPDITMGRHGDIVVEVRHFSCFLEINKKFVSNDTIQNNKIK